VKPGRLYLILWFWTTGSLRLTQAETVPVAHARDIVTSSAGRVTVVRHFPKAIKPFSLSKKINPVWWVANADDPLPPENYRKGRRGRKLFWSLRNPFHNFTFYVIGVADRPVSRAGNYPTKTTNPNGGWNWAVCRYKCVGLPFVDYRRGRFEGYFGWRTGGNFGMKLNFAQGKSAKPKTPDI